MPIPQDLRRGLIASVLLCAAFTSAALTLGRSQGVALIGRTLDVAIPLTLDSPGHAGELCPEADVFHGDSRVDGARVTARVEPASGQSAVVRVRSSLPVDEPVVTIYLRLGCNEKVTRRYVLLSEQPGEFVPPVAAVAPAAAAAVTPQRPAPALAIVPAAEVAATRRSAARTPSSASTRSTPSTDAAAKPKRSRVVAAGKAERALPPVQAQRRSGGGTSRLKVDMLDLVSERDPQLRSSAGLAGAPSTSEQVRAEAAALWRAINAQPEDVLRDLQRMQALETDVKGLRGLVAGNERSLAELREQLNQARQERSFTLAAMALLALLVAAVAVTWWLRRGERPGYREWWRRRDTAPDAGSEPTGRPNAPGPAPARPAAMDLRVDESMFESLKARPRGSPVPVASAPVATAPPRQPEPVVHAGPNSVFHSNFHPSQAASMRMVKAEELVDIQQQADFFMSLGQSDQAIEVLENHIHNNVETSALVWLDLLAIYRALKRQQDYELLRADFQRVFNAEVPSYDSTPTISGGLEDYPRALSRIAALWPSPKVMNVIEESIFRKPGMADGEPFDLEAYRELVLLYNLGREVVQPDGVAAEEDSGISDAPRSSFFETSMQPLSVARDSRPLAPERAMFDAPSLYGVAGNVAEPPLDLDSMLDDDGRGPGTTLDEFQDSQMTPPASPRLGLDIDLSGPPEARKSKAREVPDSSSIDFELYDPVDDAAGKAADK